jgi:YidC/Oxa1 family membrane protein insertase
MDNRNLILAIVLSVAIMLGYEMFFAPKPVPPPPGPVATQPAPGTPAPQAGGPQVPGAQLPGVQAPAGQAPAGQAPALPQAGAPAVPQVPGTPVGQANARAQALAQTGPRITISSPRLHGSIALTGARFDDLTLAGYHVTTDPKSAEIALLNPPGTADAYYAAYGWVAPAGVAVPTATTVWQADRPRLTPTQPVTLRWDNGQGLMFERQIALDADYMFTITQRVRNTGTDAVQMNAYALTSRTGTPATSGFYILHEGPLGVFEDTLKELSYDDMKDEPVIARQTVGGWLGITDKYWLTALIPDQSTQVNARFVYTGDAFVDRYQTDYLTPAVNVAPGQTVETTHRLFSGAKEITLLDRYSETLGIPRFDLAIDFGWFYFLTKPIFYALLYFEDFLGNYGLAILLLTVLIKLVFFPLANKSYVAMSKMKKLQPEMTKLRERFGEDRTKLNQEMMALYKREKANPAAGCLPIIIQIPVFFALYKVLFVAIEMRHAPFYGWVHDLSAPDPTTLFNLFGLIPWNPPTFLMIGVWPLIMGLTMFVQQKLNPQPADPVQAKIFMFLPLIFTVMLAAFPAGLVIYWAWNNLLSIIQQWVIMRRMGVSP